MDKHELNYWIKLANQDIVMAENAAKNIYPTPVEPICFHCQQAAEKFLKAFLFAHDVNPPAIHDLNILEKRCEAIVSEFNILVTKETLNNSNESYSVSTKMAYLRNEAQRNEQIHRATADWPQVNQRCPKGTDFFGKLGSMSCEYGLRVN